MKEIGIYIHIPFCKGKCTYCDFISFANKEDLIEKYVEKLKDEISQKSSNEYEVTTIYIGGGTPSYIYGKYIKEIMNLIYQKYNVDNNAEITIEINPGTVSLEKLKQYKESKINRISIGLQETDNKLLKKIGRIHTYEDFLETYKQIKNVGFRNINIDLMIGLPDQNIKNVEQSCNNILKLNPEHISVYSLIVEQETYMEKMIELKEWVLPSEEEERKMYYFVKDKLEHNGYIHYEISNFAKKNMESKHNTNCWKQKEYLGMGVAAHSYLNKKRFSNVENINDYINGSVPIIQEEQDLDSEKREFMILGLRMLSGIKISDFKEKFVDNPIFIFYKQINKLTKMGLIEIDNNIIKLTKKGLDFANIVWKEFI